MLIVSCALVIASCARDQAALATTEWTTFADAFTRETTIRFEEPQDTLIGKLWNLRPSVSGDSFAVLDPMNHQVRIHSGTGELLAVRGGPAGDGPGEFNIPLAATWDPSGHLWIGEQANPRMTRLRPDLSLDTVVTFSTDDRGIVSALDRTAGHLVTQFVPALEGLELTLHDTTGAVVRRFHAPHPNSNAPYWVQFGRSVFAASDSLIAVAFTMQYPLRFYSNTGQLLTDDFGSPPPSWRQARIPSYGEFAIGSGTNPLEWRASFTRIHALGFVGDECLLVVHEVPNPDLDTGGLPEFKADLYSIASEAKLLVDVDLPGEFLYARGDAVFFLAAVPPSPWTVEVWKPRACPRRLN